MRWDHSQNIRSPEQECIRCYKLKNILEFRRKGYLGKKLDEVCKNCRERWDDENIKDF